MSEGTCKKCGKPSSSGECPDCRYRRGGVLPEVEEAAVEDMVDHFSTRPSRRLLEGLREINE